MIAMKFIGKDNLIGILGKFESKVFSKKTVEEIVNCYGDLFELDDNGNWVRSRKNSQIELILGDKYSDIGEVIR